MASAVRKMDPTLAPIDQDEIAARAYELWQARGCPDGSPEVDWLQAEEVLRMARSGSVNRHTLIELEQRDDICIVRIKGRLATGADYGYMSANTRAIKSQSGRKLIADIRELDSIGSEGVGFFMELHASMAKTDGGRFVLAGPTPRVLEVLTLLGLTPIIRIAPDLEAGLALFT
jgi:anti-anti-sigma factor